MLKDKFLQTKTQIVIVIVAHIFPWFYVQERLKRPLWVGDRLPIQFS
jgi:hypothetical protein